MPGFLQATVPGPHPCGSLIASTFGVLQMFSSKFALRLHLFAHYLYSSPIGSMFNK